MYRTDATTPMRLEYGRRRLISQSLRPSYTEVLYVIFTTIDKG